MDRLKELRWVVECRSLRSWEPIAAFNVQCIAESYARECAERALSTYRVIELPEPIQAPEPVVTLELPRKQGWCA